jgi:hypothetical protein
MATKRASTKKASSQTLTWEDDPGSGTQPLAVKAPNPAAKPLAFKFPSPQPAPRQYPLGSSGFRYWVAVEALRRGATYWAPRVPGGKWEIGAQLPVLLDEGEDLNAYYDRKALNFFHGPGPNGVVYSGESPDILCHEMGHAILDAVKPGLWDAASHEVAAFHESFGDMSALLSALQLPTLRTAILKDTNGHLYRSSRLSRLAEQLGAAIRAQHPDAVDTDCLRNAVNSFSYQDPLHLPSSAPASQLSSEPHSFSRVFTGAFFESLGAMLAATAKSPAAPTEAELLTVSSDMGDVLMNAIKAAPVVSNFYSQVAAAMVSDASSKNPAYAAAIKATYVRRSILSMASAAALAPRARGAAAMAPTASTRPAVSLARIAIDASQFGLSTRTLHVFGASEPRALSVSAAALGGGAHPPTSSDAAATAFTEDLFRRGKVQFPAPRGTAASVGSLHSLKTHRVVREDGDAVLRRNLFDCGHCGLHV